MNKFSKKFNSLLISFLIIIIIILSLQAIEEISDFNINVFVVILIIFTVLALFIWEPVRADIIALSIPVILYSLNKWTNISLDDALSGFANQATITVLLMFMLGRGVENSGLVHTLGEKINQIAGNRLRKQIAIISIISGGVAGFLNNTPVVAIFIPMVRNLARKTGISPSKLLMPLSFAAMMGGMTTLIGTSTNILASDISARLINQPFSMFEFTILGVIVLFVGSLYLFFFAPKLITERLKAKDGVFDDFQMEDFLTEVVVCQGSPLLGEKPNQSTRVEKLDLDILQIIRDDIKYEADESLIIEEGDKLIIRADHETLFKLLRREKCNLVPEIMSESSISDIKGGRMLAEVVIPHDSTIHGKSLSDLSFLKNFDAIVLAIRRGGDLSHKKVENIKLKPGDVLLIYAKEEDVKKLKRSSNLIFAKELEEKNIMKDRKDYTGLLVLASVIALAALQILPIVMAAFLGVIAMIVLEHLSVEEIYDAVNWQVIFLLAGLIPLGVAMELSGTTNYIASIILRISENTPALLTLAIFYLATCILTNIISNNASVVLMIPVGIEVATSIGVNPFAFVLAITFAASTSLLTPMGYQTNLMVYGPGGYKFSDYFKLGFPLQIILTFVTVFGIYFFWGL